MRGANSSSVAVAVKSKMGHKKSIDGRLPPLPSFPADELGNPLGNESGASDSGESESSFRFFRFRNRQIYDDSVGTDTAVQAEIDRHLEQTDK